MKVPQRGPDPWQGRIADGRRLAIAPGAVEPADGSVTAGYIDGSKAIAVPASRRPVLASTGKPYVNFLKIHGARENNLQAIDFEIPLGVFTAVTGPKISMLKSSCSSASTSKIVG